MPRREDPRLLSGRGAYVDDVVVSRMAHVCFLRSDLARGSIVKLETEAARRCRGVHSVLCASDLNPTAGPMWATLAGRPSDGVPYPPARVLADEDVRFVGDPVALVIAESREVAEDACSLIELGIEPAEPVLDVDRALADATELVHPELDSNVASTVPAEDDPELDRIFSEAPHVIERTFSQGRATCLPLEPRGLVAQWDPHSGTMRIWSSSQNPHEVRAYCARLLGVSESHIRVTIGDVGGGFGQKVFVSRDETAVILAARRTGLPLKWIEDRRENLLAAGHARAERATVTVAVADDGEVLAAKVHHVEDVGAYPVGGTATAGGLVKLAFTGPYRIPRLGFSNVAVYTNTGGRVAYRGPWLMETVAREQMMDHVARALDLDPLEVRRRNLLRASDIPYRNAGGSLYEDVDPAQTVEQAVQILDYARFRAHQAQQRAHGRLVGVGMSAYIERSGGAVGPLSSEQATIRIEPSGAVSVMMGFGSSGNSVETTIPQVVADYLGCHVTDVVLQQGDTAVSPYGHGSTGSRAAAFGGGAARLAALRMREKLVALAAYRLSVREENVKVEDGVVSVAGSPSRTSTFGELAQSVYMRPDDLPPGSDLGLEVTARFRPPSPFTWSTACHVCTCEIDPDTGVITLTRYIVSEDCGVMINPTVVEGQIAGGVVQGIGGALYERLAYDEDGNPQVTTLADYLVPTAAEVPRIEFGHVETPSTFPGGFKGMGEGGAIGAPAAVANAVADALVPAGLAPTSLPITPEAVLDAIDRRTACD